MSITIEILQANIASTRQQEAQHHRDAAACAGAVQAYEQLLSQLIQSQRIDKLAAVSKDIPPPIPGTPESVAARVKALKANKKAK